MRIPNTKGDIMQISTDSIVQTYDNFTNNATNTTTMKNSYEENQTKEKTSTLEEQMNKSAVEVSLSMNAQIILFSMDSKDLANNTTQAQKNILDFLSGKDVENQLSLSDLGYEGKPITELSKEEASELVGEDGFFGVNQTSQRVANFVFAFSNNDTELLTKGREGVLKGFEDAKNAWGGELPEISYKTQTKTLELIDAKIAELQANQEVG